MPKQPLPTPAAFADKPYAHIPLTPVTSNQVAAIGYDAATKIVKEATATGEPLRDVAIANGVDPEVYDRVVDLRAIAAGNGFSR